MHGLPYVVFIAALSALTSSCAASRLLQCNNLVAIANGATAEIEILTEDQNTQDPLIWLQAADTLDKAAQDMQTLGLDDPQLQQYQGEFVTMYTEIAKATRAYSQSYKELNREGVDVAKVKLEQAVQRETDLVDGVNTYCAAN
ncbi:MAG: hypothetical protein EA366_03030 [Spirulina sp. DLM2.Bin59]|nr:MAG: hypothetical protein EA366_03030 [Spirulina sp. DLM2.Bin59]